VLAQAGMFGLIASHQPRRRYRLYFAASVALLLMFVAVEKGARSQLMATGVGLVWCYSQRVKRLNAAVISAVALAGVLLFPILGEYRNTKDFRVENRRFVNLFAHSMIDMGSTVNTLLYTMDLVPQPESYAWGAGYVEAAYQLIPNLGLRPVRGDSITSTLKAYHGNWLVWQVNPAWAPVGGYGSSMVGELYFNFGVPGILLGCALLGFVSGRLRSGAQDSAFKLTASALFFGAMIIHVRNPIGPLLKNVVWSLVALGIIRGILSRLTSRSSSTPVRRPIQL
jgi:oligosaccharide repeat unit polymerase